MVHLKRHRRVLLLIAVVSALLMIVLHIVAATYPTESSLARIVREASIRLIIATLLVFCLYYLGFVPFARRTMPLVWVAATILPGLAIAMNNFPWSAFFSGRTTLEESPVVVLMFAIECLSIGFMEETVFRGVILTALSQRFPRTKAGVFRAIVLASILFGLTHLANLFSGASLSETLLQVGYSFLMGMLWSVVYLAVRNLFFPILLHAIYNFCGSIFHQLGFVTDRFDLPTIVITTVLAIAATVFYLRVFRRLDRRQLTDSAAGEAPL